MNRHKVLLFGMCVETGFQFRTPMEQLESDTPVDLYFDCTFSRRVPFDPREVRIASARETNRYGEPAVSIYSIPGGHRMRFPGIADFTLLPGSIACALHKASLRHMVEICLLGHVLAWYLERCEIPALHGGALAIDGRAALFLANRGGGKSTLVAALLRRGFSLLGDDIAAVEQCGRHTCCRPAFPQIKLTREQADRFVGCSEGYSRVHPGYGKLSIPAHDLGSYETRSLPVRRIYLLDRQRHDCPIALERIPPGVAIIGLIRSAFLAELVSELQSIRERRFRRFSQMVERVPVMRLRYPTGYEALPALATILTADLLDSEREYGPPGLSAIRGTRRSPEARGIARTPASVDRSEG